MLASESGIARSEQPFKRRRRTTSPGCIVSVGIPSGSAVPFAFVGELGSVGSSERWLLEGHSHGGAEGHPFHVHVNPFELKKVGDRVQPPGTILDTVWVNANTTVEAWTRFEEHTGKTVFHCHILPHEDTGMMKNLLIEK